MDNEQRLELHEEIKKYLLTALSISTTKRRCSDITDSIDVEVWLEGEYVCSDTVEIPRC